MPVRKIPKNYISVTGAFASRKNEEMAEFESLLERDYLLLLEFDETVESFEVQPVRIPVSGVPKGYVPDVLFKYRVNPRSGGNRKPRLVDVKHKDDLEKNEKKYAPKFAAAHQYCEERGWEFATVDHTEIRTPRLANLRFLREYRNVSASQDDIRQVIAVMGKLKGVTTSNSLLNNLGKSNDEILRWLPVVWSMLLSGHLTTDMDSPFTNDVPLNLAGAAL